MKTRVKNGHAPDVRLTVTLKYLATGESNLFLSQQFRLGRTTIGNIIKDTGDQLYIEFKKDYLQVSYQKINIIVNTV